VPGGGRPPYIPGMTGALRVAALSAAAAVIACLAAVGPGAAAANAQDTAALGESFESVRALPAGWTLSEYVPGASAVSVADTGGADGARFLRITSSRPNHARVIVPVAVTPNAAYRFRAMARSSGADPGQAAAVLGLDGAYTVTGSVRSDDRWQPLELFLKVGSRTHLDLTLGLGHFGQLNGGTADFDAVTVTRVAAVPADAAVVADLAPPPTATPQPATAADVSLGGHPPPAGLWVIMALLAAGGVALSAWLIRTGQLDAAPVGRE
jgi:hypothetical protein